MTFSDKLRRLIDERDVTQRRLASDLQIPPSTIGGYVQGTSEPDFETLKMIARYFDVTADYLLDMPDRRIHSAQEADLLRIFRTLSAEQQELYLEQGRVFVKLNARETGASSTSSSGSQTG